MDNTLKRKDTVIIRREWYDAITAIPSADERAEAYTAIMEYAFGGAIYEGANATIKMLFALVRPAIDRANESYAKQVIQGRENGHKGGRPRKTPRDNEKPQGLFKKPLKTLSDSVSDSDNDSVSDSDNDSDIVKGAGETPETHNKKFKKPSLAEVSAYCQERNNGIDAEQFIDYYEAKGWKVGKAPMKDWKAAVRTWEKQHKNNEYGQQRTKRNEAPVSDWNNVSQSELKF